MSDTALHLIRHRLTAGLLQKAAKGETRKVGGSIQQVVLLVFSRAPRGAFCSVTGLFGHGQSCLTQGSKRYKISIYE